MRVAAFVVLCCALQYITSEIIDENIDNILNDKSKYETKNETTSDEFEMNQKTGKVYEKRTTHKEFLSKNGYSSDVNECDVKIIELFITKDAQGHERIFEDDTTIKKVDIPVTYTSSSSASAASQTPQSNSSVATGSAASATAGARSTSSAASTVITQGPESRSTSATDTNIPESGSPGTPGASPTTKEGVTGTQQPGSEPASKPVDNITGNNQNELGPDSYGSGYYGQDYLSPQDLLTIDDNVGGSATDTNVPESGSSGTPGASPTTKEGVSGTQRPESGPVSKRASTASGNRRPGLDLYGSKYNGKYYPEISSAAATAVAGGIGTTSSSSARTQGPESRSTSAASNSSSRSGAGGSGSIHGTHGSSEGSEEGGAYGNASGRGGDHGPGSGSSGSPSNLPTKKIDETRTQLPESRPVLKSASTAPGKRRPELDLYGKKYNGKYFPEISSASAKAAAGGVGPDSYRPGYYRQDYLSPQDLLTIADNVGGSATDTNIPESRSSGTPGASATTKEGVSGTQRPESGPVSKQASIASGNRRPGLDLYGSKYNGKYYPEISSAAAKAVAGGFGTTSSSSARTQGPESRSTSAASSSSSRSGAGGSGIIHGTHGSSEGSEEGGAYGNASGRGGVHGPGSGSSGSPSNPRTKKIDETRTQLPESRPVSKSASTAPGNRRPGLDFYGSKYNGKYFPEIRSATAKPVAGGVGPDSYRPGYYRQDYLSPQDLLTIDDNVGGSATETNLPESGSSGTPGASPTTKEGVTGTQQPGSVPASKPVDNITGNNQNELGPDSYGSGYYGQDYLSPQDLLTIDDNVGGPATDTNIPELGSSGTPGASPTTKEGVTGTQQPGSEPASKPVDNITGNNQNKLGPDSYGSGYYGQDYLSPQDLLTIDDNVGGSATDTNVPESGSSGTPGASPTTKEGVSGTQRPESGPVSKRASTASGNRRPGLDLYGSKYNGKYYPEISSAAATAVAGGIGTTSSSSARTQGPESRSTSAASNSSSRSGAGGSGSIHGTHGSSEGSEEGGAYGNASGRGGDHGPGSGSSGSPSNLPTKKIDETRTQLPESRPMSKSASTAPGNRRPGLDFYGSKYNGKYFPEIRLAAAKTVAGGVGPDSYRPGYYRQDYLSPQDLLTIHDNVDGSATDTNVPESGSSGTPGASPTTKEGVSGTQRPESGPVSKRASTASGNRRPGLDLYGSKYNGKYHPEISSAAAMAVAGGFGTTSSSLARTQGPESRSTSAASSSSSRSGAGGSGIIHGIHGSSEGSEEGGAYGNASGRGGVHGPGSGSSGSPSNPRTKKIDETRTQLPESRPVSKSASTAPGNRRPGLDFYGSKYNGKYFPEIRSATAKPVAGGVGPDSYRPGYYRQDYLSPQDLLTIDDNVGGSATETNLPESGSSGTPGASPTTKEGVTGTQQPGSVPASKPVDNITGNNQNELGPDSYGSGYYGQDYLSPQDLLTIDDNVGGPATDTNIPELGSSGTPGASPTTKEGVTGTQQPGSEPASKPVDNITGNNQNKLGPDSYGSGYYGQDYLSPQDLLTIDDNVGGSATDTNIPESGSSGTPGASPTTKEGVSGTQQPESGPASKPVDNITGNNQNELGPDSYGSGYYGQEYLSTQDLLTIDYNVGGSETDTNIPESGSSGTPGASLTTKEGVSGTQQPESGPASKPVDNITGNNQNELGPDSYGSGYYGQDYLSPQDLLTIDDNVGGSATDTNIPESGSSGTPGASPTTKEGVSGTQRPESGPVSKRASTASGNRRPGLDLYGSKYDGKYYLEISSAAATAVAGGFGTTSSSSARTQGPESRSTSAASSSSSRSGTGGSGSIHDTHGSSEGSEEGGASGNASGRGGVRGPGSGSSGSPSNLPTKKIHETRTQLPESRPVSKSASTAPGNRRPGLDFYGSKYNGKYFPEIRSAAAKPVAGGVGPDSYRPGSYRQDYLSPQDLLTIDDNVGGSATDTNIPESGSSGTPGASPTAKEGVTGTQQPGSGPASKPVDNITGNNQNELGPDSYGSGYYGQDYLSPQDLLTIDDNVGGPATDTNIPELGSSGTPGAAPNTKEGVSGTQRPESGSVSQPASTASGNRRPGLDLYGSKYNGKYYPEISSAAATAVAGGFGTTSSSLARTQGPESRSTSAASSSSSRSGAGGSGSIHGTHGSSEGSEEGGAYGNASGRGGVRGPGSGSSGSPSNLPTKKIDETRTQLPESRPVSKSASTAPGNRRPGLDFYGSKYNGKYFPEIRSAAAKPVAGGVGPDSYRPGSYRQDYLSPQDLLTIDDNVGGSATDTNIPESGSSGTPGASPTAKEGVTGTQQPGSGPASKPVDNITGNNQNELGPDSYGSGYYGQDYLSPQDLLTIDDNVGGSATDKNIPESGSSGTPGAAPNTKEGVSGTQRPESGSVSQPASTASGNRRPGLDLYGSKYNGKYYPEISSAAATAVAGGFGTTSSSLARTQGPESRSTSAASSSSSRSGAGGSGSIHGTHGSSEGSEEGGAYGNASGRGGVRGPGSGSSGSPSNLPTKKIDETRTQLPESRPVSKSASTAPGNRRPGLDFYGSKYNGKYFPEIRSAAAKPVAGGVGPDSYRPGSYRQDYLSPQDLLTIDDNVGGSATDTNIPESGSSGTPGASPTAKEGVTGTQQPGSGPASKPVDNITGNNQNELGPDSYGSGYYGQDYLSPQDLLTIDDNVGGSATDKNIPESGSSGTPGAAPNTKEGVSGTQRPESGSVSQPASTASGNRRPGLDLYGSKYNGKYYPEISSAAATAVAGGFGTTSSSLARTQGPESRSTSAASSSSSRSGAGGSGSIHGTHGSSEGSEEGGAYGNTSGRGGVRGPGSGSSGSPSNLPTKKIDETRTQLPESRPVSKSASTAPGNRRPGLDFYGSKYNGKYFPEIRSAAAKPVAGGVGPDSYRPGSYRQDYLSPQDLLTIDDNVGGSATDTNIPESGSSGTPGASPTTKEGVSGTQQPGSEPASKPVDNITGNNQNELGPDSYGSGYYGQDYSAPEERPNFNNNKRGSESSSSPAARESAAGIPDSAGSPSGVASGVTSVQGRKRVRQACRLRSSQFVLRLGRRGQPCTFCY